MLRLGLAVSALLLVGGLVIAIAGGEHVSTAVDLRSLLHAGSLADRLMASGLVVLCVTRSSA